MESNELTVEPLDLNLFISSQQGSFNHRRKGLWDIGWLAKKKGLTIPPKRHDKETISMDFKLVQKQRMLVRKQSLIEWENIKDSNVFDEVMSKPRENLTWRTILNHYIRDIKRRLFKFKWN